MCLANPSINLLKLSLIGRFNFGSWRLWKKNDLLAESGLLGPVMIQATEVIK